MMPGNINWYSVDPFCNPFNYTMQEYDLSNPDCKHPTPFWAEPPPDPMQEEHDSTARDTFTADPPPKPAAYDNWTPYDDHVLYYDSASGSSFSLVRTQYFLDRLSTLNATFDGFFPRWILPGTELRGGLFSSGPTSTQTSMFIDTQLEVYVGVGHGFAPTVLNATGIMLPTELAAYHNKTIGDSI